MGHNITPATARPITTAAAAPIRPQRGPGAGACISPVGTRPAPGAGRGVGVRAVPRPEGGRRTCPETGDCMPSAVLEPEIEKPSARNCSDEDWLGSACSFAHRFSLLTTAPLSARVNSLRLAKRSSRFLASIASTTGWKSANCGGSGGAGVVRCAISTAIGVSATNGGAPVSSS